ncbi:hypothetical protein HAX54_036682 [Datura stramonium]|uniref:Uncharacterized protein n=1 Tax=Datura stramonium TaxID=4076 RepID=A0ABS8VIM3_DATST|nr:hypothetical protein [Datura stramonium]
MGTPTDDPPPISSIKNTTPPNEVGSKKNRAKAGKGCSQVKNQRTGIISDEAIAAITQNSFNELMEEEGEQIASTSKSRPPKSKEKDKETNEEESDSQDDWADRTSSEEEDTLDESSEEEEEIQENEQRT